jgi:lipid-A-disaccharide synthase
VVSEQQTGAPRAATAIKIFLSAGEVSGDIVGAQLVRAIWRHQPDASIFGIGGPRMRAAGVHLDGDAIHLGAVGITEPLGILPSAARALGTIRARLRAGGADVAVLIGNDVFNVALARWLRRQAIPTASYFPPQVWIWRGLAGPIASSFDLLLTSFPDEYQVYQRVARRSTVVFVGHYLSDVLQPVTPDIRMVARDRFGVGSGDFALTLMPGSRCQEIRVIAPVMLDAAAQLRSQVRRLKLLLPVAHHDHRLPLQRAIAERQLSDCCLLVDESHDALRAADVAVLASGTASLEAALLGVPMVLVYRVSRPTHAVLRVCIRLGLIGSYTVGLPNLIAGRRIVPELLQSALTQEAVVREVLDIVEDERRQMQMRQALSEIRQQLVSPGCLTRVADLVIALARRRRPMEGTVPGQAERSGPEASGSEPEITGTDPRVH